MGLFYDSNGTAHCIPPGGMVPTDAMGAVRESGGNGTPFMPGQMVQANNYSAMNPPSTSVSEPTRSSQPPAATPYTPHPFAGHQTAAPYVPLPPDRDALLPPPYYRQKRSYPRLKKLVRVTALLCATWLGLTVWNQPRESFIHHVQRTMRIPLYWYSSIAISLGYRDNFASNLIHGTVNQAPAVVAPVPSHPSRRAKHR